MCGFVACFDFKVVMFIFCWVFVCLGVFMPKRTTVILEDEVYEKLLRESIRRYGNARNISKVINELLKRVFEEDVKSELMRLIYSEKVANVTAKEFENFRRSLAKRFES